MRVFNIVTNKTLKILDKYKISDEDIEDIIIRKIWLSLPSDIVTLNMINVDRNFGYSTILDHIPKKEIINNIEKFTQRGSDVVEILNSKLVEKFPGIKSEKLFIVIQMFLSEIFPEISTRLGGEFNLYKRDIVESKKEAEIFIEKTSKHKANPFVSDDLKYSISQAKISFMDSHYRKFDLYNVIKRYKMTKDVPFMTIMKEFSNTPIIKFLNGFDEDKIKQWSIRRNGDFKVPKGLTFKIFSGKDDHYYTASLSRVLPIISMTMGFSEDDINFDNIKREASRVILLAMRGFGYPGAGHVDIVTSVIKIPVKNLPSLENMRGYIRRSPNFEIADKGTLRFREKNTGVLYVLSENMNDVSMSPIKSKIDAISAINTLIDFLEESYKLSIIKKPSKKTKPVTKREDSELRNLENQGLKVDSVKCQKFRRPKILKDDDKKDVVSYSVKLDNDVEFYCPNTPYIYPGFTSSNFPCCFIKDQRQKESFKRNTGNIGFSEIPDENIIRKNIITTQKILDTNKLGVLPRILYRIFFGDSYYRLGVVQNNNTFLDAISRTLGVDTVKLIDEKLTNKIFNTINDGDITKHFDYRSYLGYIKNNKKLKSHDFTRDILEKLTGINIIVISTSENGTSISCKDNIHEGGYIIILYHQDVYEPIVCIDTDTNTITRIFNSDDIHVKKLLFVMRKTCTTTIISSGVKPLSISDLVEKNVNVKSQIVNNFNEVEYVNTDIGVLPVSISGPVPGIEQVKTLEELETASSQVKKLKALDVEYLHPIGQIVDDQKTVAILTKSNIAIPVTRSKILETLPISPGSYLFDISNLLHSSGGIGNKNEMTEYILSSEYDKELYERFRYTLSTYMKTSLIYDIQSIIHSNQEFHRRFLLVKEIVNNIFSKVTTHHVSDKKVTPPPVPSVRYVCSSEIQDECENMDPFCKKTEDGCFLSVPLKHYKNIITKITTELFNNDDILFGRVRRDFLDKNDFTIRSTETVVVSDKDLKKFKNIKTL